MAKKACYEFCTQSFIWPHGPSWPIRPVSRSKTYSLSGFRKWYSPMPLPHETSLSGIWEVILWVKWGDPRQDYSLGLSLWCIALPCPVAVLGSPWPTHFLRVAGRARKWRSITTRSTISGGDNVSGWSHFLVRCTISNIWDLGGFWVL